MFKFQGGIKKMEKITMAKADVQKLGRASNREDLIARTLGDVYDVELPVPEVIESVFRVERAEVGEHVYYMSPENPEKAVYKLTSACTVTQEKVSPSTRTEVSWTDLISKEYYACIHDLLKGDHDVLTFMAKAIQEAMDRQEIYGVLQLVDAGAVANANVYTLDSGKTKFDYPKLVEMVRSVAKFGKSLVLITGANVTTDIVLMNYDADKNQAISLASAGISKHIPIEALTVDVDGVSKDVISEDVAYLVAVSDSAQNKPGVFVRRKLAGIADVEDTVVVANKERAVISTGNMMNAGAVRKFSKGIAGFEEYSSTLVNSFVVAKFTRA